MERVRALHEWLRENAADMGAVTSMADLARTCANLAADLLDAHAALATERERVEAAEKALAMVRTAVSDAAKAMSRGSQEALVRVMHASPAESGQRLARAAAYDYAETLMRAALAGCP